MPSQVACPETAEHRLARLQEENLALREQLRLAAPGEPASPRGQLDELRKELRSLRDQLRRSQRLASVGTMAAMVIHEFNNILTTITNYADLARSDSRYTRKAIDRAAEGGRRATRICQAILDIARGRSGPCHPVSLADLVSETILAMGREPRKDAIEVTFSAPADLNVNTRKVELQQVLLNLLLNARTALLARPTPRRLDITAEQTAEYILIHVCDNGAGIAPEHIERIFEPFFTTAGGEDGPAEGTGLGLAICHEIAVALGGRIAVESTPGCGATFTLRLPA
jgi:signal transduction histidine kinase